jgi:Tfp pilus assembly protein PilE
MEPLAVSAAPVAAAMPEAAPGDIGSQARNRYAPPTAGPAGRAGSDSPLLTDEEAREAVIGNNNTLYYLTRFDHLAHGEGGGWNWPAFFITWYWMLYRKMWVPALIYFFAPYVMGMLIGGIMAASPTFGSVVALAWFVAWLIGPGLLANGWYFKHCQAKIREVRARGGSKEQMLARLESAGGTSSVLVIILAIFGIIAGIGILAAVSLPAYQQYTVKAKVADAIVEGREVADLVGRQYQATGQLPTDIDRLTAQATHQSKYVQKIELDPTTGALEVHVEATPTVAGSIKLFPNADASRRVTWSCSTDDLMKYVPKTCR